MTETKKATTKPVAEKTVKNDTADYKHSVSRDFNSFVIPDASRCKWYSAAIAEVPMISANADTLVIVKAKNAASKKKIRSALKKYREELIQDTCQYPMNQLKIQASKVYVKGNYVCFIMLGTISNKQEEQSEDKVIAAYKKQNEKAVKAINKLYKSR